MISIFISSLFQLFVSTDAFVDTLAESTEQAGDARPEQDDDDPGQ